MVIVGDGEGARGAKGGGGEGRERYTYGRNEQIEPGHSVCPFQSLLIQPRGHKGGYLPLTFVTRNKQANFELCDS